MGLKMSLKGEAIVDAGEIWGEQGDDSKERETGGKLDHGWCSRRKASRARSASYLIKKLPTSAIDGSVSISHGTNSFEKGPD